MKCVYHGVETIKVHSILSSYPGPGDCEGNQKIPRYVDLDLALPGNATLNHIKQNRFNKIYRFPTGYMLFIQHRT